MKKSNNLIYYIAILLLLLHTDETLALNDPFSLAENKANQLAIVTIHYGKAKLIASEIIKQRKTLMSKDSALVVDAATNQISIIDNKQRIKTIKHLIQQFDQPQQQILVKARIISIDTRYLHSIGLLFNAENSKNAKGQHLTMDLPNSNEQGTINFPIISFAKQNILNLELSALEEQGHAKTISSPKLITLNRQPAIIESGEAIPYLQKTGQGNTSTTFKKAVLGLKVTPIILPHHHLLINLNISQNKPGNLNLNNGPSIQTQELKTQVIVKNKETLVLGGIEEQYLSQQHYGIPILDRIPLLGRLFQKTEKVIQQKQLLIFVTPEVIHSN